MLPIVRPRLVILLIFWLFRQAGRPKGPLGRSMVRGWNRSHAKLTDWGLQQVILPGNAVMLDVGCGGGRTVSRLSALAPAGRIVGLDVSAASAVVAQDTNVGAIESGRVRILQGSVAALPFPDGVFDIVTAVETHYYWPNLAANVKEILRVLKPGGTLALIAEAYRGGPLRGIYRSDHETPGGQELDLRYGPQTLSRWFLAAAVTHHVMVLEIHAGRVLKKAFS